MVWKKGQSGNPAAKPIGARNKLGEAFLEAVLADFIAHGPQVIEDLRRRYPGRYLELIIRLTRAAVDRDEEADAIGRQDVYPQITLVS
jgi:hypothetical protein